MNLTYQSISGAWWPYLFIFLAGAVATDIWRWVGVLGGALLKEDSEAVVLVRAVATALVAAVVGSLVVFPTGQIAATPLALRLGAMVVGWVAFWVARRNVLFGVVCGELILTAGWFLLG